MELEKAKDIHYKGINKAFCYFTQQEAKGKNIVVYGSGFGDVPSAVVATNLKNAAKKADSRPPQSLSVFCPNLHRNNGKC